jgi:hypothetical protein
METLLFIVLVVAIFLGVVFVYERIKSEKTKTLHRHLDWLAEGSTACQHCGKQVAPHQGFCDYTCRIAHAHATGATVHLPNGLAPCCVMHDGTLLEIEHGDHVDYKHPVEVKWIGEPDEVFRHAFGRELTDDEIRDAMGEYHALIYTDGVIALTLHECRYFLWRLRDGKPLNNRDDGYILVSLEIPERMQRMQKEVTA